MTPAESDRRALLDLARGVAAGTIRPSISDSLVPLYAAENSYDPLTTFSLLVEAVGSGRPVEPLLNSLMGEAA